jgi:drug/metabolite transporter (DMT)-like permease
VVDGANGHGEVGPAGLRRRPRPELLHRLRRPGGGRDNAPNWEWFAAIAVIAVVCAVLLSFGGSSNLSLKAGAYGTVAGVLSGLAATVTKPTTELLHTGGVGGVFSNWMVYVVGIAGLLGVVFQQIALQTARLAPAVATGSVANPLVGVLLGIVLLEERLAPPTWHKVVASAALGVALAAAVAISLSEERQRRSGPSVRERAADEGDRDARSPGDDQRLDHAPA